MASHTENSKVTSIEFLECIEYEIDKELEEGDWLESEE